MIDARELRIGNWVEAVADMGNYFMKMTEHNFVDLAENPDCANPIPLTTEILGRCGFNKIVSSDGDSWFECLSNNGILFCEGDKNEFTEVYLDIDDKIRVRHVHQLQNLYYALTQKELEIKL